MTVALSGRDPDAAHRQRIYGIRHRHRTRTGAASLSGEHLAHDAASAIRIRGGLPYGRSGTVRHRARRRRQRTGVAAVQMRTPLGASTLALPGACSLCVLCLLLVFVSFFCFRGH